jgi:transcriptional regulator
MYIPAEFETRGVAAMHAAMRRHPFALLVTPHDGELHVTHLPVRLDAARGALGTLEAHLARVNPHAKALAAGAETRVVFSGPHAYVSPRWYAKPAANVPTWNYVAVHARGRPRVVTDRAAVLAMLGRLAAEHEAYIDEPWTLAEGRDYAERIAGGIVAFELPIERLEGKSKLNQNKSPADRRGVMAALAAAGGHDALLAAMRELYDEAGNAHPEM